MDSSAKSYRRNGKITKTIFAAVLLLSLAATDVVSARKRHAAPKPKIKAAAASGAAFYDAALYAKASETLKAGKLDAAIDDYCAMLPRMKTGSELWSVSVSLVCDAAAVEALVGKLRDAEGDPVFVLKRIYQGMPCYRVCFSLTEARKSATAKLRAIPKGLLRYKPFPFALDGLCPASEVPAAIVPAEQAAPRAAEKPAQGPSGPVRFIGPPVSQNNPPQASASSAGSLLSPLKAGAASGAALPAPPSSEAEAWFRKGAAAYGGGDRNEARKCYERSLELSPNKPETLNNLAILYLEENKFAEARSLLERAVDISPAYGRAHLNLAGALWGLNERSKAIEQARMAKDLEANNVQAHLTLASFLMALERYGEALIETRAALALEPGNAQAQALAREAEEKAGHGDAKKDKVEG